MIIKGYKFLTEQDAIDAREQCDAYYGIPKSPDDVTQNWVEYLVAEYNTPKFWYFIYDESLVPILGQPENLDIVFPPEP
jgi:hypothetical protein